MWTHTGPWLFQGECMSFDNEPPCPHVESRHRHKTYYYDEGDRVLVRDPSSIGTQHGRVTHYADGLLYVEGPRLSGDSRSVHWTIPEHLVQRVVTPLDR